MKLGEFWDAGLSTTVPFRTLPRRAKTHVTDALQAVTVINPALNEEASIGLVLRDLPAVGRVIVVDNGSTDATVARARQGGRA